MKRKSEKLRGWDDKKGNEMNGSNIIFLRGNVKCTVGNNLHKWEDPQE